MANNDKLKEYDYQEMFDIAKAFSDTAERASGDKILTSHGWSHPRIIPTIVNSAFSCEIFLKSLLVFSKIEFGKSHELKDLWALLANELKDEIKQEINKRIQFENEDGFEDCLRKSSNAFATWRYIYEVSGLNGYPGFLAAFSDSLREVSCRKFNNCSWEKYKEHL